jgi:hypothetical protein
MKTCSSPSLFVKYYGRGRPNLYEIKGKGTVDNAGRFIYCGCLEVATRSSADEKNLS